MSRPTKKGKRGRWRIALGLCEGCGTNLGSDRRRKRCSNCDGSRHGKAVIDEIRAARAEMLSTDEKTEVLLSMVTWAYEKVRDTPDLGRADILPVLEQMSKDARAIEEG